MWNWIADETEKRQKAVTKAEYFKQNKLKSVFCECYCCQYAFDNSEIMRRGDKCRDCEICPIDWGVKVCGNDYKQCVAEKTDYSKWDDYVFLNDWKSAAKYAGEIANLPAREEVRR